MEKIIFLLILLYTIYRSISNMQKAAKKEAEQRRRKNEELARRQQPQRERPKTLEDILTEVFGETEVETKPFGERRAKPPKPKRAQTPKPTQQRADHKTETPKQEKPTPPQPWLQEDLTPELTAPAYEAIDVPVTEGAAGPSLPVVEISRPQTHRQRPPISFRLRDAIIAQTILERPYA